MTKVLLYRNIRPEEGGPGVLAGEREIGSEISEDLAERAVSKGHGEYLEDVATEAAAELAAEKGVDLASVAGSGSGGRATKQDIQKAAKDK